MNKVPFVLRAMQPQASIRNWHQDEGPVAEDGLPAALDSKNGMHLSRATILTEVKTETQDEQ
jgi:hypothetical protein